LISEYTTTGDENVMMAGVPIGQVEQCRPGSEHQFKNY